MSDRRDRTAAEWVTFVGALVVLLLIGAAIVREAVTSDEPARPVASVEHVAKVADRFEVTVTVENRGDLAAESVQVLASLEVDGDTREGDQTVDFLAGGDSEELIFYFDDDPEDGELTAEVTGFTVP